MTNFWIVYIPLIYQGLDKRIFFSSQKELHSVWNIDFFFFVKLWLILSQLELSSTELPKLSLTILMKNCDHVICPVLSILFHITQLIRLGFLKSLSLSWERLIVVKSIVFRKDRWYPFRKNGSVISKFYCLISRSPVCTSLILVSALVKMAGNSATVIYIYIFDIGVHNFNLVNKFVSITKLKKGRINLRIMNLWQSKLTNGIKSQYTR